MTQLSPATDYQQQNTVTMDTILQQYALLEHDEQQMCIKEMKRMKNTIRTMRTNVSKKQKRSAKSTSMEGIGAHTMGYMGWIQSAYGSLYDE